MTFTKLVRLIKYIFIIAVLFFLAHISYTIIDGLKAPDHPADVIMILGNKVNEDGSLSPRLQARLDKGLELYNAGMGKMIMTTGGYGKEMQHEGTVMADYLISKGVPAHVIIVDNDGVNTAASVQNLAKSRETLNIHSVIAVSQYFHISRTKMLLYKAGFSDVQGGAADFFEIRDVFSIPREFLAFYADKYFPWLKPKK
mgnify:CR=1 FL=1